MNKTIQTLASNTSYNRQKGTHAILINEIGKYIKSRNESDFRIFNNKILQLKKLRTDADYTENQTNYEQSNGSISLYKDIIPVLKRY